MKKLFGINHKKIHLSIKIILFLLLINIKPSFLYSQVVYVPLESGVYEFLERMNINGTIYLNDEVKPFSRVEVAKKLVDINITFSKTTEPINDIVEKELKFWEEEFVYEIKYLTKEFSADSFYTNKFNNIKERWFLLSYSDSLFNLKLSPIAGYGISTTNKLSGHTRWIGLSTFVTYSNWFGLSFDLRDKGEFGDNVDKNKHFSSVRGAWYKNAPDGIEFSDVKGSINFNWSWGRVSLIKDYMQWGHAKFGQIILSDKAPSYPQIRFQIKPVDWLIFTYIHGWLSSQVYDSAYFYYSYPGTKNELLIKDYIPKYIAANMLTVSPLNWLDVSAGNAVIYSGDLRPEFFIPFMFYKLLDHNSGRGDVNDANGMMFFDISAKYPKNFQFYASLFIDVTEIRNVLNNNFENTWTGFTFGGKSVDVLFANLDVTLEYTRINPWVYEHKNEVIDYKHINYYLGHWIGQNADQLRLQFNYQLLRGLKFMAFGEAIRKGGLDDIYYAYEGMGEKQLPFLYAPKRIEKRFGFDIVYEYLHDLKIKGSYVYSDVTDDDSTREPVFLIGSKNSFSITLNYGF